MAKISEDYCSYEVAKFLKEKGFDEICDHYIDCHWKEDGVLQHTPCKSSDLLFGYMCPTHQMAMKWLREEHNIIIIVDYNEDEDCEDNERYGFTIYHKNKRKVDLATFPTYEEAVEAALKYCLTNLI